MDVNKTYHGNHFTIYTYIKSSCCTTKTNTVLYVSYVSLKLVGGEGTYHLIVLQLSSSE